MPRADAAPPAISHFPPLYPALIALVSALGLSPMAAARWLNALLFGANIFLVGALVRRAASTASWPSPFVLGLTGAFFALTSVTLLRIHSMAWSEPAFIFFWLLGVVALVDYRRTSRRSVLVAAAVCGGLVLLTRYAGLPVVATGAIALLFFGRHSAGRRVGDAVLYLTVALVPFALWLVRNLSLTGTATNRSVSWQPLEAAHWIEALDLLTSWLLIPTWLPPAVTGLILVAAASVAVGAVMSDARATRAASRSGHGDGAGIVLLLGFFSAVYVALLCVSIMLFDHYTPVDERILSPLFVAGTIILLQGVRLAGRSHLSLVRYGVATLVCVLAVRYVLSGAEFLQSSHDTGLGFNSAAWRRSVILKAIDRLPPDVAVYSNWPEAIFLRTGRPMARLPWARRQNPRYEADLAGLAARMRTGDSVIAYFHSFRRVSMASEQDLLERLPLTLRASVIDGAIYGLGDEAGMPRPLDGPKNPHRAEQRSHLTRRQLGAER